MDDSETYGTSIFPCGTKYDIYLVRLKTTRNIQLTDQQFLLVAKWNGDFDPMFSQKGSIMTHQYSL